MSETSGSMSAEFDTLATWTADVALQASRRLFALPVVQGDAAALPLGSGCFDLAWSLGVLCTTKDQPRALRELRRVLGGGGLLGLLVFLAARPDIDEQPDGNEFPTEQALHAMLQEADLAVTATAAMADLAPPPQRWTAQQSDVEREVEARHAGDPALRIAQDQEAVIHHLFKTGQVHGQLLALRAGR